MFGWLYEVQHCFRPGYSCGSQLLCQDIAESMDEGARTDAIIIDVSNAFGLVPHDRLIRKIAAIVVDLRVVVWVNKFLLGRSQRVRVDGQLSEEVRVISVVPNGRVLDPLQFVAYVDYIWKNVESNTRLLADGCVTYRKIMDISDIENSQTYLNRLEERTVKSKLYKN